MVEVDTTCKMEEDKTTVSWNDDVQGSVEVPGLVMDAHGLGTENRRVIV